MDASSIIPYAVIIIIVIAWIGLSISKRRSEGFKRIARQRGLSFSKRADREINELMNKFQLFSDNSEKTMSNVIRGKIEGITTTLLDYRTGRGRDHVSSASSCTLAVFQSHRINLPAFTIHPRNFLHTVVRFLGVRDIEFPSHNSFSKKYILRGDEEEAVRRVFSDQVRSWLENHEGLCIEGRGDSFLYYHGNALVSPDKLHVFLKEGLEVFRLFEPQ